VKREGISRSAKNKIVDGKKIIIWDYVDPDENVIINQSTIDRCNKLVLPPAWVEVWISPDAKSDLQATGKDAKGRVQYKYHENWTKARAAKKFDGMSGFANMLPVIRGRVEQDLKLEGMPREKVVALVIKLMDLYHIRVGNDEYARRNKSYGLTTLTEGHLTIDRSEKAEGNVDAVFEFTGKSGKLWKRRIWEDELALLIEASSKVGGNLESQDLFRYEDKNGKDFDIKSNHINEYLDAITAKHSKVTAKDFRTWAATWKTASRLSVLIDPDTATARKKLLGQVIKTVSADLGNTPTVCKSSYIHPSIISDWERGTFRRKWNRSYKKRKLQGLSKEETSILHYLSS
jgi:DNA topoisomerase-1